MSIGMLGHKVGMTQIFSQDGSCIPVTILKVGPCVVTKIYNHNNSNHIQIGYQVTNPRKVKQPNLGIFNKLGIPCLKYLKEYKNDISDQAHIKVGQVLTVQRFKIGHSINISGISIGKGFSGYQKRHHFHRGPMSHGSKNHRQPGSIGAGTTPGRVFPGKRMAGRLGGKKITIRNLKIIDINIEQNILLIKGSVPGKSGNLIQISKT